MKFFNKKAFTLWELITSLVIIWVIITIIFVFVTSSVKNLAENTIKTNSIDWWLSFQKTLQSFVNSWYSTGEIISVTGTSNGVLYLKKPDLSAWVLIWIVNLDDKKIQPQYVYWDNFIGYRELSKDEVEEINEDESVAFDKIFQLDKLFLNLRAKDFELEWYNNWDLINVKISIVNKFDDFFGEKFDDLNIENLIIYEYNLVL